MCSKCPPWHKHTWHTWHTWHKQRDGDATDWWLQQQLIDPAFSIRLTVSVSVLQDVFRSLNTIFSKIDRNTSKEVILKLTRSKCIPILIYGLECFALTKSDLKSLDFAVSRFLMKIFRSNNTEIIAECRRYFQFNLPSELIEKRKLNSKKTITDVF